MPTSSSRTSTQSTQSDAALRAGVGHTKWRILRNGVWMPIDPLPPAQADPLSQARPSSSHGRRSLRLRNIAVAERNLQDAESGPRSTSKVDAESSGSTAATPPPVLGRSKSKRSLARERACTMREMCRRLQSEELRRIQAARIKIEKSAFLKTEMVTRAKKRRRRKSASRRRIEDVGVWGNSSGEAES